MKLQYTNASSWFFQRRALNKVYILFSLWAALVNAQEAETTAAIRVANMLPSVPLVDFIVDGRLRIRDIEHGEISDYIIVPTEELELSLMPHVPVSSDGAVVEGNAVPKPISLEVSLTAGSYYTMILSHTQSQNNSGRLFGNTLSSIFLDTFIIPIPGNAHVRLVNTSETTVVLTFLDTRVGPSFEAVAFEALALDTGAIDVLAGPYTLSFDNKETKVELQADLQAGTLYTFYVFKDGQDLVINVDVDGVLGTTLRGDK
jgi:Domain of unknown function (DUF4397)